MQQVVDGARDGCEGRALRRCRMWYSWQYLRVDLRPGRRPARLLWRSARRQRRQRHVVARHGARRCVLRQPHETPSELMAVPPPFALAVSGDAAGETATLRRRCTLPRGAVAKPSRLSTCDIGCGGARCAAACRKASASAQSCTRGGPAARLAGCSRGHRWLPHPPPTALSGFRGRAASGLAACRSVLHAEGRAREP